MKFIAAKRILLAVAIAMVAGNHDTLAQTKAIQHWSIVTAYPPDFAHYGYALLTAVPSKSCRN